MKTKQEVKDILAKIDESIQRIPEIRTEQWTLGQFEMIYENRPVHLVGLQLSTARYVLTPNGFEPESNFLKGNEKAALDFPTYEDACYASRVLGVYFAKKFNFNYNLRNCPSRGDSQKE